MGISREAYQGRHIKGTSRAHQSTSRAFQGHIKGISRAYQGHIRAHQGHFKGISRAYQGHIKGGISRAGQRAGQEAGQHRPRAGQGRPRGRPRGRPGDEPGASQQGFSDSPRARTSVTMLVPGQVTKGQNILRGRRGPPSPSRRNGNPGPQEEVPHSRVVYFAEKEPF